jgi:hypothetical protein
MPIEKIKKEVTFVSKEVAEITMEAADFVEGEAEKTVDGVDSYISPIRETVLKRYPLLFSLLVISGAVTTLLGFEYVLHSYGILATYPWMVFFVGVAILSFTGGLYNSLSKKII